jgi:hypothetical protein
LSFEIEKICGAAQQVTSLSCFLKSRDIRKEILMIVMFSLKCKLKPKINSQQKTPLTSLHFSQENITIDTPTVLDSCLKMKHYVLPFEPKGDTGTV